VTGPALVEVIVSDAVIVIVGTADVGAVVAGAVVAGAVVAGAVVAGAVVAGAVVAGAVVAGAVVAGAVVAGAVVAGAVVAGAVVAGAVVAGAVVAGAVVAGAVVAGVVAVLVVVAAGVVGTVPDEETWGVGLTTGPTVVPVPVVGGLTRALMIGESPVMVPDRLVEPPIAFGLPLELPLALACAAAGDSIGSAVGAGQLVALQAMNPLDELPDCDALVPYQQMSVMAPKTPVPITRFRTECGRW
jgi:hypothetical protein